MKGWYFGFTTLLVILLRPSKIALTIGPLNKMGRSTKTFLCGLITESRARGEKSVCQACYTASAGLA